MKHYKVECVCTTDDPVDDLHNHIEYAKHKAQDDPLMIPAWRPDKAMNIEKPEFAKYVEQLSNVSGVSITKFADMVDALKKRHEFFEAQGSKLSDHGIEEFYDEEYTDSQIETIFEKAMRGQQLSQLEIRQYKNCFLTVMAEMDADAGWTQQFHYGAIRDNNTAMYNQLGPDTGFDSIGEFNTAKAMSTFLNKLNMKGKLTRTILYTLNPCANEVIATMLSAPRVLPPHPLQPAWQRRGEGPAARRPRAAGKDGGGHLVQQRETLFQILLIKKFGYPARGSRFFCTFAAGK